MKMLAAVELQKMRDLSDFLETVPPEDFNLAHWRERSAVAPISLGPITLRRGCGFAGCAMGWAAEAGLFPRLRISKGGDICYRGATGFEAAAKLLGVTPNQSWYFFSEHAYAWHADPADVADRMRRFVEIVERRLARSERPMLRLAVNN